MSNEELLNKVAELYPETGMKITETIWNYGDGVNRPELEIWINGVGFIDGETREEILSKVKATLNSTK